MSNTHHLKQPLRAIALAASILLLSTFAAQAQVSVGIALPGISIGINVPVYPRLQRVPGYPVYYDPAGASNYFFYDGLYWVLRDDTWYRSSWYNGPWLTVQPEAVPLYVLRVPVRYYRQPPAYFRGWRPDAPPRWGEHWGPQWQQGRSGWDRWDRRRAPAPAPLPSYQRRYGGEQYPHAMERQDSIRGENYRYRPREGMPAPQAPTHDTSRRPAPPPREQAAQQRQPGPGEIHSNRPQPGPISDNRPQQRAQPQHDDPGGGRNRGRDDKEDDRKGDDRKSDRR